MERNKQGRFVSDKDVKRYRVTVWNMVTGDIEEKLWEACERDVDSIEHKYSFEPGFEVQVEERY